MEKTEFTRQELYDLAWKEPMTSLCNKYFISYHDFRKICKEMNIPLPKVGHWQKVQAGKPLEIEDLPEDYTGKQEVSFEIRKDGVSSEANKSPLAIQQKEIEADSKLPLTVPEKLSAPDPLIIKAKKILKEKHSRYRHYNGVIFSGEGVLDIGVSEGNIERALRFMDTLIKLLRARGHDIMIEGTTTYAVIGEEKIKICLKEKNKRVVVKEEPWVQTELQPTGILSFRYRKRHDELEVKDGSLFIEDQLAKIVAKLEIEAKRAKEERLSLEKMWAEQREKERIRKELQQRKEKDLSDFKELMLTAQRWQKAKMIRNYLDKLETKSVVDGSMTEDLSQWLEWARKKVEWYDPLTDGEDELLKEVDKETLAFKRQTFFF